MSKRILCIDFDGVLHSYASGWKGVDVVADRPTRGAIPWLQGVIDSMSYRAVIYSSRSKDPKGVEAMKQWLLDYGITKDELAQIDFPSQKPPAFLTIDDRAICFRGTFPSHIELDNFRVWNK